MTQIEKIKAEVKRLMNNRDSRLVDGSYFDFKNLLSFIESLEKEQEPNWITHKVDLSDESEEYRKAYYDGWNNCNQQHSHLPKIKGWVAREPKFNLMLFTAKPERFGDMWDVMAGEEMPINPSLFPDLCWEDEPIEVELIVNRI